MGRVPWALRDDSINPSPLREPQDSNRNHLAHQFRRGWDLDDDLDPTKAFHLSAFSLGSMRSKGDGDLAFISGFNSGTDKHSRLSFNIDRRWVYVNAMPTNLATTPPAFLPLEVEIPVEDITSHGLLTTRTAADEDDIITLTIVTRRPGRFFANLPFPPYTRRVTERDFVYSVGRESTAGRNVDEMKANGYIIHEGHAGPLTPVAEDDLTVQVNAWLTWRFEFRLGRTECQRFSSLVRLFTSTAKADGIDITGNRKLSVVSEEEKQRAFYQDEAAKASFACRYMIECLLSHGVIATSETTHLILALDKYCMSEDHKVCVLVALFSEDNIPNLNEFISMRAKQLTTPLPDKGVGLVWVYNCIITPTRLALFPPEKQVSNELYRQFSGQRDRLLRVTFADENDGVQINPTVIDADTACPAKGTLARIRRACDSGLVIAGRQYVFFGYSVSSARDRTCWFISEDPHVGFTVDVVRHRLGLGGVANEKVTAAGIAAKMEIPLSATRIVPLKVTIGRRLPDIWNDKLCATDGVGRCGGGVAQQAARSFGFVTGADQAPSAIQIRCGGIVGVLSVWPDLCRDDEVRFRPSQIEFETALKVMQYGLSALKVAQFSRAVLNRQFIVLLTHLEVNPAVIQEICAQSIARTRGMALRLTSSSSSVTATDLRATRRCSPFPVEALLAAGFGGEPFHVNICHLLETHMFNGFKWRGTFEIENGVELMGIADEIGVLEEGEVFCQYHDPEEPDRGPIVVRDMCAIMRAPSYLAGDVRVVTAVDHPRLRHLKNVIVFSVRGQPLPPSMSGGNLDGDNYTLIWDDRLVPRVAVKPTVYWQKAPEVKEDVTVNDYKELFIDFLKNDILGDLSNALLAHADRTGTTTKACWELARQANIAANFHKTGVMAQLSRELRPTMWPTFMAKDVDITGQHQYNSNDILGRICRMVRTEPNSSSTRLCVARKHADLRLERYNLPDSVLGHAYELKLHYDSTVLNLMKRFDISEAEVVAGVVLLDTRRRRDRDEDVKDRVSVNYRSLVTDSVLPAADAFMASRSFSSHLAPRQIYALAAYQVTCVDSVRSDVQVRMGVSINSANGEHGETKGKMRKTPAGPRLLSFPWVFWEALCSLPNVRDILDA